MINDGYADEETKMWAFESLKQLPFLQDIEKDKEMGLLHKIYYAMQKRQMHYGDLVLQPGIEVD